MTFRLTQVRCRRPNRLVHELTQTKSNTSIEETSGGDDIFMLSLLPTRLIIGNKPEPWHSHCTNTTDTILYRCYSVVCDCWNQQWVSWCWDSYCCSQSYMSLKLFIRYTWLLWRWFRGGTFCNRVIKIKQQRIHQLWFTIKWNSTKNWKFYTYYILHRVVHRYSYILFSFVFDIC